MDGGGGIQETMFKKNYGGKSILFYELSQACVTRSFVRATAVSVV